MPDNKSKDNQKSIKYWQDRALQRENEYQAASSAAIEQLNRIYDRAFDNIEKEIKSAVRQLDKKYYMNGQAPDAEAYHARLTRLEGLKREINNEIKQLAGIEHDFTTNFYIDTIKDGYYKTMFDIQKGLGYGFDFNALPNKVINETLTAGWAGDNYSKRVWKNAESLADKTKEVVQAGILSGIPVKLMVEQLDGEALKQGKFAAQRLIRTETNYFANQGELRSYEEAGIEKYEFLAVLDTRTSDVCQDHDGEIDPDTNEPYLVKNVVVGKNYPPLHAFCRSTTVARFDAEVLDGIKRRARDPVTGELTFVDAGMNYREWKEKYTYNIPTDNKVENSDSFSDKLKNLLGGNKPQSEILNEFDESVNNLRNANAQRLLKQARKKAKININLSESRSYHSNGKVTLGSKATPSTIAHELFHYLDYKNSISTRRGFKKAIANDYRKIKNSADGVYNSIKDMLHSTYPNAFIQEGRKIVFDEKYRGVSDILNGMTGDAEKFGYGHKADYWSIDGMLEAETWAQFGRIFYDNDKEVLAMAKELFSHTFDMVESILEGLK